tara:strand:+ start:62 stop:481 length:420 start_codon:yes stop_codon:yes gene_type:complete
MTVKKNPSSSGMPGDFVKEAGLAYGGGGGKGSILTGKKSSVSKKAKEKLKSKYPRSGKGKRKREMKIGESPSGKGFHEQEYKTTIKVRVKFPEKEGGVAYKMRGNKPLEFTDEIKGLNAGHALTRAKSNWPGAAVVRIK